jgi:hypothetical protein
MTDKAQVSRLENKKYDIRCICNRKLMRAYLAPGSEIEIRCPKCGYLFKHARRMPPDGYGRHEEVEDERPEDNRVGGSVV